MKTYKVLCLTDHIKQSKENSLYAIVSQMSEHSMCDEVVVASRSTFKNDAFFIDQDFSKIYGVRVYRNFSYEKAKRDLYDNVEEISTANFDIIFLRLPRPISDEFLLNLEQRFSAKCIINKPSGIIESSTKAVLLNFPDICPPISLCHSIEEILAFQQNGDLVLKPLKEYGGKGLLKFVGNTINDGSKDYPAFEYLKSIESYIEKEGYLAMKFLKNVSQGDKRLIVVDGEIVAASLRLPPANSWLCNVAAGGTSIKSAPDEAELNIVKKIDPFLKAKGILIYGVDTLVDDDGKRTLSEINTLSIGGFPQAELQTGKPIILQTLNKFFNYADEYYS